MRTRNLILAMITIMLALTTAYAYHHNFGILGAKMGDLDGNADGVVTFEEFEAYNSKNVRSIFDALDSDKDGKISPDEWNLFLKVHGIDVDKMS